MRNHSLDDFEIMFYNDSRRLSTIITSPAIADYLIYQKSYNLSTIFYIFLKKGLQNGQTYIIIGKIRIVKAGQVGYIICIPRPQTILLTPHKFVFQSSSTRTKDVVVYNIIIYNI